VGDSGRYIVLKSKNNLSIFESETKKLTSPVKCGEKSLITAGFRSFFVYDPDSNECEVWDFKGTKEKSVASPFSGQIVAISQGNGSDGPILCVVKGEANNNFEIELLDPYSLNPLAVKIPQKTIPLQGPLVARCAALGRAWTIQEQDRKNAKTLFVQLDGEGTLTWKVQEVDSPYVVFGTDGNTAYAKGAFISYENLPSSFPNAITCYFPSSA